MPPVTEGMLIAVMAWPSTVFWVPTEPVPKSGAVSAATSIVNVSETWSPAPSSLSLSLAV